MTTEGTPPTDPAAGAGAPTDPPATDPVATPPADPPAAAAGSDPAPPATSEPPGESAGEPPGEPPATAKSDAAKKGHKTRQERAKRRADLTEDPDVQILLDQARKEAGTQAKEAAAEAAKRESMSELDRAVAEATEANERAEALAGELKGAKLERAYNEALIESELKVRAKSRKILRGLVKDAMGADVTLTLADAIHVVSEEHDYLLQPTAATPATPGQAAPQPQRSGASTAPTPKRETASPATPEPTKPLDVTNMSKMEFRAYQREKHGINPMH